MAYSGSQITRLGSSGTARILHGSFVGKAESSNLQEQIDALDVRVTALEAADIVINSRLDALEAASVSNTRRRGYW